VSWAIWITGPTGSGKSTLAKAVVAAGEADGRATSLLTLENAAQALGLEVPLRLAEEPVAYGALLWAARLLTTAGVAVVIDAAAPRRKWRELARGSIRHYAEVELVCPPATCGQRAQAARWAPTGEGGAPTWSLELPYEGSLAPELTVLTDATAVWSAVEAIQELADRLTRAAAKEDT
jgi:adenylylsulfate kinase-like enzyme